MRGDIDRCVESATFALHCAYYDAEPEPEKVWCACGDELVRYEGDICDSCWALNTEVA